jgi:hypothetical protein
VSDELNVNSQLENVNSLPDGGGEEFEEITSDEVDRVVEQLEGLIETVGSENIRYYLEEAVNTIYALIYDDADDEDSVADAA